MRRPGPDRAPQSDIQNEPDARVSVSSEHPELAQLSFHSGIEPTDFRLGNGAKMLPTVRLDLLRRDSHMGRGRPFGGKRRGHQGSIHVQGLAVGPSGGEIVGVLEGIDEFALGGVVAFSESGRAFGVAFHAAASGDEALSIVAMSARLAGVETLQPSLKSRST